MSQSSYIQPQFLKRGDCVGIIAPARKVSAEEIAASVKTFESWGLQVKPGQHIFAVENQYAGNETQRRADYQNMLNDPEIKAIIAARGGYGSVRIIDGLDFSTFRKHPKWIVGYSDVTVMHSHIHTHTGIETLHGPMPISFSKDAESLEWLRKALFGEELHYAISPHPLNRKGTAQGTLVGGNLSLLYALASTPSDIDTSGKILFLEDLDEYLYHVDRMMMQLKRSGKLSKLNGLVIGSMSDMKDNTVAFGKTAEEIIADAVAAYNYPVCYDFPAGHGAKNFSLYLGRKTELAVQEKTSLKFL